MGVFTHKRRNGSVVASTRLESSECYTRRTEAPLDDNKKFCTIFQNVSFSRVTHAQTIGGLTRTSYHVDSPLKEIVSPTFNQSRIYLISSSFHLRSTVLAQCTPTWDWIGKNSNHRPQIEVLLNLPDSGHELLHLECNILHAHWEATSPFLGVSTAR